jgi:hypothetical protein
MTTKPPTSPVVIPDMGDRIFGQDGVLDLAAPPDGNGNGTLDLYIVIACWSGEPGSYVATVTPL